MISDRYKRLVNGLRAGNGMKPVFPSSAVAQEIVDATDADDDGGALELLRRGVKIANGEDDGKDDDEKNEFTQLGVNAVAARRLARLQATLAEDPAADEKRAKVVKDMAAFVLSCHKAAGWMK